MRIAIGGISHETNTYVTDHLGPTGLDRFERLRGEPLLDRYAGSETYLGGAIDACRRAGIEPVPTSFAIAEPSGTIIATAFAELIDELTRSCRATAPPDAVLLELHGACSAEGTVDADARIVEAVRSVVGPDVPIAAVFDLHGNPTERLVQGLDVLLVTHHYPHSDQAARGHEAVSLLVEIVAGRLHPVSAWRQLPMLASATTTYHGPGAEVLAAMCRIEEELGLVDCSVFHGFPWTDTPAVGCTVVTTADGDRELAERAADRAARELWAARHGFLPEPSLSPAAAVRTAMSHPRVDGAPVVVNEASDNPGAGTAGDGTHLLRALLDAGPRPGTACFGFVVCPGTAAAAHEVAVGDGIDVRLGGWSSPLAGEPVVARARVVATTDGRFALSAYAPGMRVDLGPTARLEIAGVDVIVASRPMQTFCPEVFRIHGIDVGDRDVVALKSAQHFRAGFEDLAAAIVRCEGPGLTGAVQDLPRRHAAGPFWPNEPGLAWSS